MIHPMNTIEATFDGAVFRPKGPVALAPDTLVRLTVEPVTAQTGVEASFLHTAQALKLEGPPDWSESLDDYLYGEEKREP
jgi:hypothetical protein